MNRKNLVGRAVAVALAANAPQMVWAQSASDQLDEVVVTATRRETSLQDAPITLQVLDSKAIETLNIGSFSDYLQYSPNMQGQGAQPGTQFTEMRGIGAYGGNLAQAGTIGAKASVATYLDDIPLSAGGSGTRNTDLYVTDIDRIEILAGPQGTLFGSASMSGAIRMISNKPRADAFDAKVSLSGGQTQGSGDLNHTVEAMVNVPLIADRLAVRLAAYSSYQAGYLDNTPASESLRTNVRVIQNPGGRFNNTTFLVKDNFAFQPKDMNDVRYQGGRVSLGWQITDDWSARIQYTQQKLDTRGPFFYRDDIGDLKVARYEDEFNNDDTRMAAWTVEGRLAALDVVYSGSYLEREIAQTTDYSQYTQSGPFFPYYACNFPTYTLCQPPKTDWSVFGDYRIQHHELRVASDPTRRLSFIAGAYYHKNGCEAPDCGTSIEFAYYGAIANGFAPNAPVAGSISYIPSARRPGTMFFTDMSPIVEELSFFGDVTFKISDRWSASVGARKYKIDQSATGSVNFGSRTNPDAGVNFSTNLVPVEESDTIKRLNVNFDLTDNTKLYATYSEGFSTGGYNRNGGTLGFDGVTRVPLSYDTETTENFEFGWKTTFADRRGRLNGAIYRINWDGIVVGVLDQTITNALFFINAGQAQVTGLEADLAFKLDDRWTFFSAIAVTDSELTALAPGARNIVPVGSQLARQPVLGGNARLRYDFNLFGSSPAYAMFGAIYQGSRYNGVNPTRTKSPDYAIFDLNVGTDLGDNWSAQLSIKNLTNERYELARSEVPNVGFINKTIGRPRTIGLTVTYKVN
jgi:iron complex outermembrane receptor protein